jgi:hypothetical protein
VAERRCTDRSELDAARTTDVRRPAVVEVTALVPERLLAREAAGRPSPLPESGVPVTSSYVLRIEDAGGAMGNVPGLRIGDPATFYDRLEIEVEELAFRHPDGLPFQVRLLGGFPSLDYLTFWADMLQFRRGLTCLGSYRRLPDSRGLDGIATAIEALRETHPTRFLVGIESDASVPETASPEHATSDGPAPRVIASAISAAADVPSHGSREPRTAGGPAITGRRAIVPLAMPAGVRPAPVATAAPTFRMVRPTALLVEESYQRDLSPRSVKLIRKIVSGWDWAKFKPPVCAETPDGLHVIDGQHTAIAAASHPDIGEILVVVVEAPEVESRAGAFVAHNRDRLAMSALQIFVAEVTAGSAEAISVLKAVTSGGGRIPRNTPAKGGSRPGEIVAIAAARRVHSANGPERLERLVRIAVASGVKPISSTVVYGLQALLAEGRFAEAAGLPDADIARALGSFADIETEAQRHASAAGMNRYRACAVLVSRAALATDLAEAA